jgi:hypothetical protein
MNRQVWLVALFGVVAGVALAACAGKSQSREAAAPSAASGYEPLDGRKDDVRELWIQIRQWRVELGMAAEPAPGDEHLVAQAVGSLRFCAATDAEPTGGTCGDVCNIKEAICDNADSICRIADELEGDAWAAGKCKSAKASCKEATDRCCACADGG